MTKTLEASQRTMTSSLTELTKVVGNGRTLRFNVDKLNAHVAGMLDSRLARAVEPAAQWIEKTLEGFERRVSVVGSDCVSKTAKDVDRVLDRTDKVAAAVTRTEARVKELESKVTWTAVGRAIIALIPLSVMVIVFGGLFFGLAWSLGLPPLLSWAWTSFATVSEWWAKLLIAVGTIGGVLTFRALAWWGVRKLVNAIDDW